MKAITVPQPNSQLIALGVQTIWTSKRSTKYRGPLVIHAGMAVPRLEDRYGVGVGVLPPHLEGFELPLGAIVASCNLVDVVPIVAEHEDPTIPYPRPCVVSCLGDKNFPDGWLEIYDSDPGSIYGKSIPHEAPYGDFTPGNYAWLLEDVQPVEKRCPACWEPCDHDHPHRSECVYCPDCPVCHGRLVCEPIPTKGKQGLWTVTW